MEELYKKLKPFLPYFIAFASGALMIYGFAPFTVGAASMASCVLFLWCLSGRQPKQAFWLGWIYGLGTFGLSTSWIYVSIHDYGNAAPWLATLITGMLVIFLALYPALLALTLNTFFKRNGMVRCLLAFPALWVIFEMLRGWFLTGFPWLFVGYSQIDNHLRAFASLGSVWAVSWVAVLVAGILYSIIDYFYSSKRRKKLLFSLILCLVAIWGSAFSLRQIQWVAPTHDTLNISLIQGNIPQLMRWDPRAIGQIINTYEALTSAAPKSEVIIWPEAAIPVPLPLSGPLFQRIGNQMKAQNASLIAGVPTEANAHSYYNSLIAVGNANGLYHKSHLVPFGEYVPLEKVLRGLIGFFDLPMSSMISGPKHQSALVANGFSFAPAICYEIAYPIFVQQISRKDDFILTVSNDAWFGKSIGPWQHLQIAQFRALEMGKYVIRATNTGLTAVINPFGEIQAIAPQFESTVLTTQITRMVGQTLWSRYGVWPLLFLLVGVLVLAYALTRIKRSG